MKKKRIRRLIILILFLILAVFIYLAYIWFQETQNRSPYSVIPDDAVFVLHTDNASNGWEKATESDFWKSLKKTEKFEDISKSAAALDTIINENKTVAKLLENRPFTVSTHMTSTYNYESLITVDLLKASKIVQIKDFALQILKAYGYNYKKINYHNNEFIRITNKENAQSFYISFVENIMTVSFSKQLIKHTIDQTDQKSLLNNPNFKEVENSTNSWSLFRFFFNYNKLEDFIRVYQNPANYSALIDGFQNASFSGFDLNISDNGFSLEGQTLLTNSASDLMEELNQINASKPEAFKILPKNTAVYLSFAFQDFNNFQSVLKKQYKLQDSASFKNYEKRIAQIKNQLNIDVKKYLTSWIGQEIALLKLQPDQKTKIKNAVLCLQAQDITEAKDELAGLNSEVKDKLPASFESKEYHGYPVYYLNINGLFRFLFSDLLSRIEKPYYTFIDDYVVFSNNLSDIYQMIDSYIIEETLEYDETYMDFTSSIDQKAPLSVYIQTPEALKFLYAHANTKTKSQLEKNKEAIATFSNAGIQFIPGSGSISTNISIHHDPYGLYKMNLREMESAATELHSMSLKNKNFKLDIPESHSQNSTYFELQYENTESVKASGELKNGKPDGDWRIYYPNGNIEAVIHYNEGNPDGEAYFYYNTSAQDLRCKTEFSDGQIDGDYKEFYKNGNTKAKLEFDDNQRDGDAEFYYPNGNLKIEAKYKNDSKKGDWKYFAPNGEEYDRKYWRSN